MKRHKQVSTCPVCGKNANISRKLVKTKTGKIYYYIRFYHSPLNIHFSRTNSSFSNLVIAEKKAENLYSALIAYIDKGIGQRKLTYSSLKKEIERSFGGVFYNEEFNRSVRKAITVGLIERTMEKDKPLYSKTPEVALREKLRFDQIAITYFFSGENLTVSTFLEPINTGHIPIRKIPFFIPYGPLDSLDSLNFRTHDESDEISHQGVIIAFSTALETGLSILLNRVLRNGEKDIVFAKYSIPNQDSSTNFLAQASVTSLRISVIAQRQFEARMLRTLANGAKETEIPFPRHCFYMEDRICFQVELDGIMKGENVSVKLVERRKSS